MKHRFIVVLMLLLLTATLFACGQEDHPFDGNYDLVSLEIDGSRTEPNDDTMSIFIVDPAGGISSSVLYMEMGDLSSMVGGHIEMYKEGSDYNQYKFTVEYAIGELVKTEAGDYFYLYHYPKENEFKMDAGAMAFWYAYKSERLDD